MPEWKVTCDIKDILRSTDSTNPSDTTMVAREIADRLKNTLHGRSIKEDHDGYYELEGIIECFETEEFDSFEEFNTLLEELYDWANTHRVWLGA